MLQSVTKYSDSVKLLLQR